ncbi:hypothetical protein QBC47DRAFT_418069 [Echria macrotheca]|uniref:Uncharacterized protein n=1 Tax=Echria macrotheca TaxID=438768 RepID=A0AAJ0F6X2_9PEZI|nr:hypothetical protein QBC47DRAFT_418069 [Echria macrotheca]
MDEQPLAVKAAALRHTRETLEVQLLVAQGNHEIMNAIRGLQQQMDARFQQMEARFQQIDARFQQIDARFQQTNTRLKRLENESVNREISVMNAILLKQQMDSRLQALINVHTGQEIPNFPHTIQDLLQLDEPTADAILIALGLNLPPNTALTVKRESIRRRWMIV